MSFLKRGIIFIGTVCVGKSARGKLVSEAIYREFVVLDIVANKYYIAAGSTWS